MDSRICWTFLLFLGLIIQLSKGLSIPRDFDVIILTQNWPKTNCLAWKEKSKINECNLPKHENWTIHGIWPTQYGKRGPNWCRNDLPFEPKEVDSIRKDLEIKWTDIHSRKNSASFWKHEWEKHGTCSVNLESLSTQKKYFQIAMNLYDECNIMNILGKDNIFPGGNYPVERILDAVQRVLKVKILVTCYLDSNREQNLHEIGICFDKKLNLIDCTKTAGFPSNCKFAKVNYLKGVPPKPFLSRERIEEEKGILK